VSEENLTSHLTHITSHFGDESFQANDCTDNPLHNIGDKKKTTHQKKGKHPVNKQIIRHNG